MCETKTFVVGVDPLNSKVWLSSYSQLPIVNINGYADQNDENIAPANTVNNTCKSKDRPAVDYKAQFESLAKRVRRAGLDLNPNISFKKQLESVQRIEIM